MYLGLRELFGDYSMLAAPASGILAYYAKVGSALGARVPPPRRLLLQVIEDLIAESNVTAARDAYNALVSGYGAPSNGPGLLARIVELEKSRLPAETVEGLLATPFPTPEEVKDFLGEWVGDMWMSAEQPRTGDTTLRIKVVEGQVVGETVRRTAVGQERVQRWEYLKVSPQGLTWGNLNGMRPRGVVLFEGKLEGGTLAGKSRFAGIDFRLPNGSPAPSPSFSFKRVRK
jgi:hypothetical protein